MRLWLCLCGLSLVLAACGEKADPTARCALVSPQGQEVALTVEVMDDDTERARGLMFRKTLPTTAGMVFVWPDAQKRSMWMQNTFLPLDMLFLRGHRIVGMIENTTPLSETILTVDSPADRVLEVNAGSLARWGVTPQWRLTCPPPRA